MATAGIALSPSQSSSGNDIVVTYEDQQKINRFARLNAKKDEIIEELNSKKTILQNIKDALSDIDAATLEAEDENDVNNVRIMEGEVFVSFGFDSATSWVEGKKKETESEIDAMKSSIEKIKEEMNQLKTDLYAKFGKENINLESDDS